VEAAMDNLFAQDIYIRLAEDYSAFICTTKYGRFSSKTIEFTLNEPVTPEGMKAGS
jgi:hypothetical protein